MKRGGWKPTPYQRLRHARSQIDNALMFEQQQPHVAMAAIEDCVSQLTKAYLELVDRPIPDAELERTAQSRFVLDPRGEVSE